MKLLIITVTIFFVVEAESNHYRWRHDKVSQSIVNDAIPVFFDWRNFNATLPPRDMGNSTKSWAFAVASAIETGLFNYNGTLEYLSVQYLLDCAFTQNVFGLFYHTSLNGIPSEEAYPYTGEEGLCKWVSSRVFTSYSYVFGNETLLQEIVAKTGPLTVTIDGINLANYTSGIIDGATCEKNEKNYESPWSAVIIGYGSENGTDYWIMKNSLGTTWGEEGYFRLKRGVNACGITNGAWTSAVVGHTVDE
ncbi:uncharacterized protein [Leptinotarsa decemlineata]|uniref:uncharacterized protein n=1 Tax=Leptinotarsa decemlineata TaxID=7539 RepID=UPI003D30BB5E